MRTIVRLDRLDERLLTRARQEARRRGVALTTLIEEGLRLVLRRALPPADRAVVTLPASGASGGTLPGVDLDDSASLLDHLDSDRAR
jgi:hypothetical protein